MIKQIIFLILFATTSQLLAINPNVFYKKSVNKKIKEIILNPLTAKKVSIKGKAKDIFKKFSKEKKIGIDFNTLKQTQKISNGKTTTLRYIQFAYNLPVFNSEVLGVIYDNKVIKTVNNTYSGFKKPDFDNSISIKTVIKNNPEIKEIISEEKGYWGEKPCFRFLVKTKRDLKYLFVDSISGKILFEKSLIITFDAQGKVFYPNPVDFSGNTELYDYDNSNYTELQDTYKTVNLIDIDPSGKLKNKYVDLTAQGIAKPSTFGVYPILDYTPGSAIGIDGKYFYTRDNYAFEEVNAYYWISEARKYIESMNFNILPNPIPVNVHYMTDDNSFYSELDHGLHFGDGGVDDAEDAEIILHEFMHAVTHYIVPGIGDSWEAGSLDEGLSDYFAATFSRDTKFRDYIGEWDATSYNPGNPAYLRPIKTNRHYPENMREPYYLTGQRNIHWDGVIFSSTLWQIRKAVGREFDKEVIEMLYHLSTSTSFQSAALSLYSADLIEGEKFKEAIAYFFYKRGILPENYPSTPKDTDYNEKTLYFPFAEEDDSYSTYIGIINISNNSATVKIDYISKEGFLVLKEKEIILNPGEKYYDKVNPDQIDTDFWIRVSSNETVKGYIYSISKDRQKSFVLKGIDKLSDTVFVPHIAPETDYWQSVCAVANCTGEATTVLADIKQGNPIELNSPEKAYSMNRFDWYKDIFNPNNIEPVENWATIYSQNNNLAAYQYFFRKDIEQAAGLTLDMKPSNVLYFPHIVVEGNYWWTGIVFENTSDTPEILTIYAYDTKGNILDSFQIDTNANQKIVCLAQNLWTDNNREFPENTAWIKIKSEQNNLIGYQLFGTLPEKGARLLSGINAISELSNRILFPHIISGNDYWTGIAIINPGTEFASAIFKAYDSLGNLLEEKAQDFQPGEKTVFLVKDMFSENILPEISYITVESNSGICGFEIFGNLTSVENGETIKRQDYIAGLKGINIDE